MRLENPQEYLALTLQSSLPRKSAGKITTSGGTIIRSLTPRSIGRKSPLRN